MRLFNYLGYRALRDWLCSVSWASRHFSNVMLRSTHRGTPLWRYRTVWFSQKFTLLLLLLMWGITFLLFLALALVRASALLLLWLCTVAYSAIKGEIK